MVPGFQPLKCAIRKNPDFIPHPDLIPHIPENVFISDEFHRKQMELAGLPRVAFINSRVIPRSRTGDRWVQKTIQAVAQSLGQFSWMVGSIGALHYNTSLHLWLRAGGRCCVVSDTISPFQSDAGWKMYQPFLEHPGIEWVMIGNPLKMPRPTQKSNLLRDIMVMALSHTIIPIHVTPDGNMAGFLRQYASDGGNIQTILPVPVSTPPDQISGKLRKGTLDECRISPYPFKEGEFLWHYTRGRHTPWPGHDWTHYLDGLVGQGDPVPYGPLDSLNRILKTGIISSSDYLIRGKHQVVCLTSKSWNDMRPLFHWQTHLRRQRFEPYAIGIRRSIAEALNVQPVIYDVVDRYDRMDESDRFRFQRISSSGMDWTMEEEWRCPGDLNLTGIHPQDLKILVPTPAIQKMIRVDTSLEIVTCIGTDP